MTQCVNPINHCIWPLVCLSVCIGILGRWYAVNFASNQFQDVKGLVCVPGQRDNLVPYTASRRNVAFVPVSQVPGNPIERPT